MQFFSLIGSVDMGNLTGWSALKLAASGTTVVESLHTGLKTSSMMRSFLYSGHMNPSKQTPALWRICIWVVQAPS